MTKATEQKIADLHGELADAMSKRLKDPSATAADLNVIRQFVKDNGVTAVPTPGSPLGKLVDDLPSFPKDEDGQPGVH